MITSNDNLIITLSTLRDMRAQLVEHFTDKNNDFFYEYIVAPSHEFQTSPVALKLSVELYFSVWLDLHYNHFEEIVGQYVQNNEYEDRCRSFFYSAYADLIGLFVDDNLKNSNISQRINREKCEVLKEFLRTENRINKNSGRLKAQYKIRRNLFRREIENLKMERGKT